MYLDLFLTYAKVGAMTFGGGYAMLPILKREMVDRKGWITEDDLVDAFAIGQCTPGVIAVNVATLIGYQKKGFFGAVCSTTGVITPPVFIIVCIASVVQAFSDNVYVKHALAGMNVAICAVIALTVVGLLKKTWKGLVPVGIGAVVFALTLIFDIPTVLAVLAAAIVGIALTTVKKSKNVEKRSGKRSHLRGGDGE